MVQSYCQKSQYTFSKVLHKRKTMKIWYFKSFSDNFEDFPANFLCRKLEKFFFSIGGRTLCAEVYFILQIFFFNYYFLSIDSPKIHRGGSATPTTSKFDFSVTNVQLLTVVSKSFCYMLYVCQIHLKYILAYQKKTEFTCHAGVFVL